jgi:hypothetical protein
MIIYLNDYPINDISAGNKVFLNEPIQGLSIPPLRTTSGDLSGQDGGYVGAQLYGMRLITLTGWAEADNPTAMEQTRRDFQAALSAGGSFSMTIVTDGGNRYLVTTYLSDFTMDISGNLLLGDWKVDLIAPDPTIYDDTGDPLTATISKASSGGLLFSSTSPVFGSNFLFTPGDPNASVSNSGIVMAYPVITISGQTTSPVITNVTTNQTFELDGYTTSSDSVTVIDMHEHTVTLNGGNAFGYVSQDSEFWGLVPDVNEISFTSGSGSDASTATLTWRPGLRGI